MTAKSRSFGLSSRTTAGLRMPGGWRTGRSGWQVTCGLTQLPFSAFVASYEFLSRFGDLGTDDLVAHVHYQLFGEVMEDAARAHYANQLRAGRLSLHRLVPEIIGGAQPEQLQLLENRLRAARMIIAAAAASPGVVVSNERKGELLQTVSGDPASLETFCARVAGHFPGYVSE